MKIDPARITEAMLALEDAISADPDPDVAVGGVIASLVGLELDKDFEALVLREVKRARQLGNGYYARSLGKSTDNPAIIGMVAFLQGVVFARAVQDALRAEAENG